MSRYTVFLPPPSFRELKIPSSRSWVSESHNLEIPNDRKQITEKNDEKSRKPISDSRLSSDEERDLQEETSRSIEDSLVLTSQRLARMYKGDIFKNIDLEEDYVQSQREDSSRGIDPADASEVTQVYDWSVSHYPSQRSNPSQSAAQLQSFISTRAHTQATSLDESTTYDDITRESSDASIHILPQFQIFPQQLASLKRLQQQHQQHQRQRQRRGGFDADMDPFENPNKSKVSILVGLLDVEGPDYVRLKQGVDAGKEVALLKVVLMDADGIVSKLTTWRDLAESWGDLFKKGDVVLFQNVLFTRSTDGSSACTASEKLKSKATICYRTFPTTKDDRRLRPDLRLAALDPGMAKVAQVVQLIQQTG
ncbi:hypothetical protein FRC19_009863 [Serendipita sp. 401]|nr:hypothetical protein FRC19_009863 [Serendipita sp. 401]